LLVFEEGLLCRRTAPLAPPTKNERKLAVIKLSGASKASLRRKLCLLLVPYKKGVREIMQAKPPVRYNERKLCKQNAPWPPV
ncbi:hypothetical protein CLOM_g20195, partial [Closterium sp. NIES-68]